MKCRNIPQAGRPKVETDPLSPKRGESKSVHAGFRRSARQSFVAAFVALCVAAISLCSARADITTGLVGYWNLSDGPGSSNVVDSAGNGNTGMLSNYTDATFNNMWTNSTDPVNGWPFALLFNETGIGNNTYVTIPNSPSIDSMSSNKQWTLSAWVNCAVAGGSQPVNAGIVSKGNFNREAFSLYITGGKFTTIFHNAAGSGTETVSGTTTPNAGTWYHVAATVLEPKGSATAEAIVYVNGVRESGSDGNTYTTVYLTNLPTYIGSRASSSGLVTNNFQGTIDEVRIYNRALSASDILQLYQNKAFPVINKGIGSWNGLAGSGGNATLDASSLNFCTNLYSAPVGTASSLANLLSLEASSSLSLGASFADVYYSSSNQVPVTATNLTMPFGGVAFGSASGAGTMTFNNVALTYVVNSSDNIGIKDGANPTSLIQNGAATTILTGNNSFSGGVSINAGTIQLGNGGAISGQELGSAGTVTDNGTLVFNGNNSLNFSKGITGNGSVMQIGSGTLTLSSPNNYTNATTIANATLSISSANDSGGNIGSGPINMNSGTLIYTGTGDNTSRGINGTAGTTNTIDVAPGATLEFQGRVTSSAAWVINKNNTGTLTLSGSADNAFLGVNVNGGTLVLNKSGGTGHAVGNPVNVASGATLQLSGNGYPSEIFSNTSTPVTINSGGVFDANGQSDGWNSLILSGTGIGGTGALINSAASTTSTLSIGAGTTLAAATTVGGPGNITLTNPVAGVGPLTYSGTGILLLGATNSYTGGTFVTSGTLDGNAAFSIPGNITLSGTAALQIDNAAALFPVATLTLPNSPPANSVNLNYAGTQNIGVLIIGSTRMPAGTYGASATNPNGVFTNTGLLNVVETYWDANGTDAANGTNTFGGGNGQWNSSAAVWWVGGNSDTTWTGGNNAFFGGTAGTVTLSATETANGLYFLTPGYNITNTDGVSTLILGGSAPLVSLPSGTTSIGCTLTGGGTVYGLTATGPGTLVLAGTNTYTNGTVIISNATVSVKNISDSGTSGIATNGDLNLSGGTLVYTGAAGASTARNVTAAASTTNTIDVAPSSSLTLNGAVRNNGSALINKTNTGTLSLGGSTDNPSLAMNINGGLVILAKSSATNVHGLGGAASSVGNGAELQLASTGVFQLFNTCALTVNTGGILDVNSQSDSFGTFTLSGAGSGSGALINSTTASNSFLTNGGSGVVLAGATAIGGPGGITMVSAMSGTGPLTYVGSGTLTLGGAGSFSGGLNINPGSTVTLNNSATSAGTGTITESAANSTLNVGIVGNNATLTNPITGPGIVNIVETSGNNLQLGGSMSSFTGVVNCPASASTAKMQILTTNVSISSAATINVANGGTFYVANTNVTIPCPIYLLGAGNSEVYGALRVENGALISGPVILLGNTTMGNGQSGSAKLATISGPIIQSNGTFGVTFTAEPGTIVLTGTNTYAGSTTISGGLVQIGGNGTLGGGNYAASIVNNSGIQYSSSLPQTLSGVMSGTGQLAQSGPGTLSLTQTNTFSGAITITNGSTLTIGGAGALGATGTSNSYSGTISNYGILNYASSQAQFLAGSISGTGSVTETGPGTLTLSSTDSYTGPTTVKNGGTLALSSSGSINNTASVSLLAGGTFDVSAFGLSYTLGGSTSFYAGGTGTGVGTTAATLVGGASGTVNVASLGLSFAPTSFNGDTNHPALYVSQGIFNLSDPAIVVSNTAATPLGAGTYRLVQVAGGNMSAASTNVTVVGTGLAAGGAASLTVSNGNLNMVVVTTVVPQPAINSVVLSGGNLILSGTNGPANGTYYEITTTNISSARSTWTPILTNTFSPTGTFSVTNAVTKSTPKQYFAIQVP
jgi:autotransporter-associated beta strand protein